MPYENERSKMKKLFNLLIGLVLVNASFAQDTLDIFQCFNAMEKNYPKAVEKELIKEQTEYKLQNIKAEWFPSLDVNVQASYQSDVVEVNLGNQLPFPVDFPTASKDQYKATLDVKQMIYDGGAIQSSKKAEHLNSSIQQQFVEIDLYKVKEQISQVYFGVLLLQKQKDILEATLNELDKKTESVQAGVRNGALLPSDLQSIKAEKISLVQNMDEIERNIDAYIQMLNEFTGLGLKKDIIFSLPEFQFDSLTDFKRPENELFDLQKSQLSANKKQVKSQKMPKVFAFGQAGYGKPGLNMLQDEFDSFYILGAKLSWNLWDWSTNKRQRNQLEVQKQIVDVQQETFNNRIKVKIDQIQSDIDNYKMSLERDKEIIDLREQVISSARSKLENGVITSSEYISDLNKLKKARITCEQHKVELIKSKLDYLLVSGNLINHKNQ